MPCVEKNVWEPPPALMVIHTCDLSRMCSLGLINILRGMASICLVAWWSGDQNSSWLGVNCIMEICSGTPICGAEIPTPSNLLRANFMLAITF